MEIQETCSIPCLEAAKLVDSHMVRIPGMVMDYAP